jgi:Domain of unknown function (DUF5916)/Carbohydrate family 9 binding domain-like
MLLFAFALAATGLPAPTPASSAAAVTSALTFAAAPRPFQAPTIDGRLDEELWKTAPAITDFRQAEPNQGADATEPSFVRVAVDDEALYVAADLRDRNPALIGTRLARRDRWVPADSFIIYLDPQRDRVSGVYFGVSAAGTQYDGTLSNDDWRDDTWDGVWQSAVALGKDGWSLEMRIPLSQLRFDGSGGRRWGINFERYIERKKEQTNLAYRPRTESGFVSRFPELAGVEAVSPPPRIEAVPYLSVSGKWLEREAGDPFADRGPSPARAGFDVKVGLTGNLTLDGTILPDFGQVEVDPAVINLSDVETFYPEKRPFFIEGAAVFNEFGSGGVSSQNNFDWPHLQLFYSRRIGRAPQGELPDEVDFNETPAAAEILCATKLSGKINAWSLGALAAVTGSAEAAISKGGMERAILVEPLTSYGATRALRTFQNGRHGLGMLATVVARDLDDPGLAAQLSKTALVAGLDGWTQIGRDRTWALGAWGSASRIDGTRESITAAQRSSVRYYQRPLANHLGVDETRTSLSGFAGRLVLNKQRGNVLLHSAVGAISPGYEVNDIGFLGSTDRINAHAFTGYQWTEPNQLLRRSLLMTAIFGNWDFGGTNLTKGYWAGANFTFANYWSAVLRYLHFGEATSTRRTRGGPPTLAPAGQVYFVEGSTDWDKPLRANVNFEINRFDHDADRSWSVGGELSALIADRLRLSVQPRFQRGRSVAQYLETEDDPTATATFGQRYLFGDLYQRTLSANLRATLIFTPKLSFELFMQPLAAALHYRSVNQLAAPYTFTFLPTGRDPADYSEHVVSLRGSAVLRWEFRPGSTLYLVWNGNQAEEGPGARFDLPSRLRSVGRLAPNHVFMAKLTYWWGL